jgi:hypothetical protein
LPSATCGRLMEERLHEEGGGVQDLRASKSQDISAEPGSGTGRNFGVLAKSVTLDRSTAGHCQFGYMRSNSEAGGGGIPVGICEQAVIGRHVPAD